MSLSLLLRKWVIGGALATAIPSLGLAQTGFSTNGGEYSVSGSLPGDQTSPGASVRPNGGYVVWNDSGLEAKNGGVAARALDSRFVGVSARFRVNQNSTIVQGAPGVVLLKEGGAGFVWQGGKAGLYHIYARFLSASNSWVGGDVLVSSATNTVQRHPSVACLADGNLVVVYGSLNQRSSTSGQDVYGQILTPAGQKVGAEFPINQFLPFNQRTPCVCALPEGGFVVTWVSEQERVQAPVAQDANQEFFMTQRPSVDIYARAFTREGAPLGDEFLVNGSVNVCADPAVAAVGDNRYVITWAEKNLDNRVNGWDVLTRACAGTATVGPVLTANSYVFGDQFAPQISALRDHYLVVWSSMGQDGSWEGVYARYLQADGAVSGAEFLVNSNRVSRQMQPLVAADGSARFVVAWSGFMGLGRGFDVFAQQYAASDYVPAQTPVAGYGAPGTDKGTEVIGPGGDGGGTVLDLTGPPAADFPVTTVASNAFSAIVGTYNGLFYDEGHVVDATHCGAISLTVAARGSYSGRLQLAGKTYSFSGKFNPTDGWATNSIRRSASSSLALRLQFDASQGTQLGGSLVDTQQVWTAQLHAERLVYNQKTRPASLTGKAVAYTVVLAGGGSGEVGPGYGTVRLEPSGTVAWSGTLADGTKVSQSTTLSREGFWPLYSSLSSGKGVLLGWVQLGTQAGSQVAGDAVWVKPAVGTAKYYPEGLTNTLTALGSIYVAPAAGGRVMGMSRGTLTFSGGQQDAFSNDFAFDTRNRVTSAKTNGLSLSFSTSGLFTGKTKVPGSTKSISFQGVLLPQGTNGTGMFLGTRQSGRVDLIAAP